MIGGFGPNGTHFPFFSTESAGHWIGTHLPFCRTWFGPHRIPGSGWMMNGTHLPLTSLKPGLQSMMNFGWHLPSWPSCWLGGHFFGTHLPLMFTSFSLQGTKIG